MWRSLVAHLHGVQGVEGSNPFTPTNKIKDLAAKASKSFLFSEPPCPACVRNFRFNRLASESLVGIVGSSQITFNLILLELAF